MPIPVAADPSPRDGAVETVLIAAPRGFCAGVEMAIKALAWMVRIYNRPVYCFHEIVHNHTVVDRFRRLGVVFVDDIDHVPPGAPVMLSAHGSAPDVATRAAQGRVAVDAACPLVTKVHHELKVRASRGYDILYIGHEGHDEAIGTMAVAPHAVRLIRNTADVMAIPADGTPKALLAQTTLSHEEWAHLRAAIEARFRDVWLPGRSDLCFATTNRQAALRAVAERADTIVIIGSENSSNTLALVDVARSMGVSHVYRIDGPDELPHDLSGTVAITAGASAPEELVEGVLARLNGRSVEYVSITEEDEYFPLPPMLRELTQKLTAAVCAALAVPRLPDAAREDRCLPAGKVLGGLLPQDDVGAREAPPSR